MNYYECLMDEKHIKLNEGMTVVNNGHFLSILNSEGKLIADRLCRVEEFIDGWAYVCEDVGGGDIRGFLINKAGREMKVYGNYLSDAYRFENGKALVEVGYGEWYVVDKKENVLTQSFELGDCGGKIEVCDNRNFLYIFKNNAWGILNLQEGKIIVPCVFNWLDDDIEEFNLEKMLVIVSFHHHCENEDGHEDDAVVYKLFKLSSGDFTADYFDEYEWLNDNILVRIDNMWGCLNTELQYTVIPECTDKQDVIREVWNKEKK